MSGLEEAGVGWGQAGDEGGKERAGRLASSCPFILAAPYFPGPHSRDPLMGLGVSKVCANVKQKLKG